MYMAKPLVSIIIPAWNTGDTIRHIASSVLAQPFRDFELILVDDGSTDDTLSVLRAIAKTDSRVRVFTKQNGGPSSARNLGLERAMGEYIQFYDADDDIDSDALTTVMQHASKGTDIIISGWQIDRQISNTELIKNFDRFLPPPQVVDSNLNEYVIRSLGNSGTLYNLWNKLFRTEIIREHHLHFREDLRFGEDLLFALEYLRHSKRIHIIPNITYHYKVNSEGSVFSSSSLIPEYRRVNDDAVVEFAKDKYSDELQWLRWRWLMSYWSLVASSKKPLRKKIGLIREFRPKNLSVSYDTGLLGIKKVLLQMMASLCRRSSYLAFGLGLVFSSLKRVSVALKTQLRRLSPSQR